MSKSYEKKEVSVDLLGGCFLMSKKNSI